MGKITNLLTSITRTKVIQPGSMKSELTRCLTLFDLTIIGIGNMAGSGIYVLSGTVIRDKSGPAIPLSLAIAGIAAFFNAICYAELTARIPTAGSAYTFTYVASGELLAFLVGWSIILEYVLSVASVARGFSGTVDSLLDGKVGNATKSIFGEFKSQWFAEYPDFLSLFIILVLAGIIAAGPRMSANFNGIITTTNCSVIIFTIITMFSHPYKGELYDKEKPGFMPFGFAGVLAGAGTCFYSYIGFDAISISSEEAVNPKRDIAGATGFSLGIVTFLFVGATTALILFIPWNHIDRQAAFSVAMHYRGLNWAKYITGIGSLFGILAALFTSMYSLPRVAYVMANDGLLPKCFAYILPSTKTPVIALAVFSTLGAILAVIFPLHTLADFLSVGTIAAYSIVCLNVCVLRYSYMAPCFITPEQHSESTNAEEDVPPCLPPLKAPGQLKECFKDIAILKELLPGVAAQVSIFFMFLFTICLCAITLWNLDKIKNGDIFIILIIGFFFVGVICCLFIMGMHEQDTTSFTSFKVPWVPLTPFISIFINMCLIVTLQVVTWIRFAAWIILGLIIYFSYGIWNSREREKLSEEQPLISTTKEEIEEKILQLND